MAIDYSKAAKQLKKKRKKKNHNLPSGELNIEGDVKITGRCYRCTDTHTGTQLHALPLIW